MEKEHKHPEEGHQHPKEEACSCGPNCHCGCHEKHDCQCGCGCPCKKRAMKIIGAVLIFAAGFLSAKVLGCKPCLYRTPYPQAGMYAPTPKMPHFKDGNGNTIIIINTDGKADVSRFLGESDKKCGCDKQHKRDRKHGFDKKHHNMHSDKLKDGRHPETPNEPTPASTAE